MLGPAVTAANALAPHSVFDSMYENVMFPMQTLYSPPVPPSMLMGRYKPPSRPGPKYRNDLSVAGPREHWAQTQVARVWRGILTRRRLRNERNYFEVRTRRAIMIQCWWRRLRAIWLRRSLQKILDEWVVSRRENMVAERLRDYGTMMTWQRKRFEEAVIKVQRAYRWYRSNRANVFAEEGASAPEKLPFPLKRRRKVYFPWRKRGAATAASQQGLPEMLVTTSDTKSSSGKSRESSLQFRKHRYYPGPPTVEEAKVINDAMRAREAKWEATLAQPEVQDRMQWKRDGLRENNFDHNAGIIQRFVRYKWDGLEKETRKITTDYFNAKVSTIQRAFRVFKTLRRIQRQIAGVERRAGLKNEAYARAKLAEICEEGAWQSKLLDSAARTIQMFWAHYLYKKQETNPFRGEEFADTGEERETGTDTNTTSTTAAAVAAEKEKAAREKAAAAATPPPYGLLKEHVQREHAIRDAARSKMEKEMAEAQKNVRRSKRRYIPAEILTVSGEGVYIAENLDKRSE
ncbi:hypothetical protein LSM04_002642 [Trypanosoma melophagium]|uniref:uncharacterized protein n=1 Tax=Trypanosoma melophagium TaxID=715481 RepID=UPI00351A9E0B|nr:hypothetical protein LSM04_002642 [Trypanosoma melophagium]